MPYVKAEPPPQALFHLRLEFMLNGEGFPSVPSNRMEIDFERPLSNGPRLNEDINLFRGDRRVTNNQVKVGYIPALSKAALSEIGVDCLELDRPPASDEELLEVLAIDGRQDADTFEQFPTLVHFSRPTSERERRAYGLPTAAFAVVSRDQEGYVITEYLE